MFHLKNRSNRPSRFDAAHSDATKRDRTRSGASQSNPIRRRNKYIRPSTVLLVLGLAQGLVNISAYGKVDAQGTLIQTPAWQITFHVLEVALFWMLAGALIEIGWKLIFSSQKDNQKRKK